MITKCKKVLCIFLIILTLFNFIFANNSFAADETEKSGDSVGVGDVLGAAVDGAAGILLMPAKFLLLIAGEGLRALSSEAAEIGAVDGNGQEVWVLSLKDIFFHNVKSPEHPHGVFPILDVNFFDENSNDTIGNIRNNIAGWYYAIRNLAICISLLVLIYIGIRMAISTLAEDKVKYKKMLTDWIVGFITIFLLHYIIIATIYINEALVTSLYQGTGAGQWGSIVTTYEYNLLFDSLSSAYFTTGMTNAIVFVGMSIMGFIFVLTYMKRMLTVAFLIIIAPIITVTYSIDKLGDGKSQALNTWLKEFIFNVLIQPFHCIIYMVFFTSIINLLESSAEGFGGSGLGAGVLAIIMMMFIKQAEEIVRTIFGFGNAKSLGTIAASALILSNSIKSVSSTVGNMVSKSGGSSGGSSSGGSSGGSKKPALKDTSNAGNTGGGSTPPLPPPDNSGGNNSSRDSRNSGDDSTPPPPSDNSGGNDGSGDSENSGDNSMPPIPIDTGDGNGANSGDNRKINPNDANNANGQNRNEMDNAVQQNEREYNTEKERAEKGWRAALNNVGKRMKVVERNKKAFEVATGVALGGVVSGDLPGMMAGIKVGETITAAGGAAANKAKTLKDNITRNSRIDSKTNKVIDAYNDLKAEKGWDDNRMLDETERLLDIKDTSRIRDQKLKTYADTVQSLRTEYEGRYQAPNDMVLDRVNKVQKGQVSKKEKRKYKRQPRTLDRNRFNRNNGNNRNGNSGQP